MVLDTPHQGSYTDGSLTQLRRFIMPWGANRLTDSSCLLALRECLSVDPESPSGLVWAEGYHTPRSVPGTLAGSLDARTKHWVITAKGFPLYCRHAVWMLANNSPLNHGMDITHADGDLSNLRPDNLIETPLTTAAQAATQRLQHGISASALKRRKMPFKPDIRHMERVGWVVEIHTKEGVYPLVVVPMAKYQRALLCAALAGQVFGYMPAQPLNIPAELQDTVREIAAAIYTPDTEPLTPAMRDIVDTYNNVINMATRSLIRLRNPTPEQIAESDAAMDEIDNLLNKYGAERAAR